MPAACEQRQGFLEDAALGQRQRDHGRAHPFDPLDVGAERAQLGFHPVVAAVEVVDAVDQRSRPRRPGRRSPGWPRRAGRSPSRSRRTACRTPCDRSRCCPRSRSRRRGASVRCTCMKRFSKIVSVTSPAPSAMQLSAMNCACMSVGKPGYSVVRKLTACGRAAHVHADASPSPAVDARAGFAQLVDHGVEVVGAAHRVSSDVAAGRPPPRTGRCRSRCGRASPRASRRAAARRPGCTMRSVPWPSICAPIAISSSARSVDLRLVRRVLEHGLAFGQRRGHQQVLGAGDGDHVGRDARALAAASALGAWM